TDRERYQRRDPPEFFAAHGHHVIVLAPLNIVFQLPPPGRGECYMNCDLRRVRSVIDKTYRLIGADGRPYESLTKGTLGGHRRSKIYGRLDCPGALRVLARGNTYQKSRVFFADEATAIAAGYRPCAVCLRDAYRMWKHQQRE